MKKIFLSHRFTGEDLIELTETLGKITAVLRAKGHEVYCSVEDELWFREHKRTNREIMEHALRKLDDSDVVLAFIRSPEKSEGMLLEIGYAVAKGKPFILALKQGLKTMAIAEMADPLIEFESSEDLCGKLNAIF
ncbi:MAG: nucleoside 2-deoxyribosyltransferase [Candidatus Paceibacterota bacterium]|jgi:nucleoside 2-deoxyribosyltransferase|nr:nucleoside 2-deoxyribosyltransferase [Candidatus Paceibacterota bacterium]